eukprot:TRINITY_DN61534_c0_g1_i1.p1 TRINITY_DN61534_c0_g1~~TRINITY_DN61534_c0_g1_i1.p1  ORF type:complete len:239 (+),score=44.25 TRINITY_DN61534_c0_g1_i1:57-719(+)
MAQTLLRQSRALEEAAALPTLGPKIRASDIDQIKRGISSIASLVGSGPPEAGLTLRPAAIPSPAADIKFAKERKVPSHPAAPRKATRKAKPSPTAAQKMVQKPSPTAPAQKAKIQKPSITEAAAKKVKTQKAIGKGVSRGRRPLAAGISQPELRRLARRAGVQRMACTIYDEMRGALAGFLSEVVGDVTVYAEHGRRKTATPSDVVYSLRRRGKALYGYA